MQQGEDAHSRDIRQAVLSSNNARTSAPAEPERTLTPDTEPIISGLGKQKTLLNKGTASDCRNLIASCHNTIVFLFCFVLTGNKREREGKTACSCCPRFLGLLNMSPHHLDLFFPCVLGCTSGVDGEQRGEDVGWVMFN